MSSRVRIPKEDCTGHRAGIDTTPLGLAWVVIRIRHATQHHHKDCTDDVSIEGENADERGACHHRDQTAEEGSRQRENHGKQGMSNQPLLLGVSYSDPVFFFV